MDNKIVKQLQKMPENEFTERVLVPLFTCLGFFKVEFFGGIYENGKDILCWGKDRLGNIELTVAQVKKLKFTTAHSSSKSLSVIISQLTACLTSSMKFTDKKDYFPSNVYLISPFEINTLAIEATFKQYPILIDQRLKIIDIFTLFDLIQQNKPDIFESIFGVEARITEGFQTLLNNQTLLKALGFREKIDIKTIYTNIDFSIGKNTTQLFFNTKFKPKKVKLNLSINEFKLFKSTYLTISKEFSTNVLNKSIQIIESENERIVTQYKKWVKEISDKKSELSGLERPQNLKNNKINAKIKDLREKVKYLESNEPEYNFINGDLLVNEILKRRNWIETRISEFNKEVPPILELRMFLERCESIINSVSLIFNNRTLSTCLGYEEKKIFRTNFDSTRLALPLDLMFDTGLNFIVLGEAGAGKTTSLQMYALNRKDKESIMIWAPLSRIVQSWDSVGIDKKTLENDLLKGLSVYFNHIGISISEDELLIIFKKKRIVVLFDGLDEAIKPCEWLPDAIRKFSNEFKKVQFIVSSRVIGDYLDRVPFFNFTILPFTTEQRDQFVANWFTEGESDKVETIRNHLKKNKTLSETIKNPLLTTTLCVLAQNNIQLPSTEVKLYNSRLKLLSGYYDLVKGIETRIITNSDDLLTLAQRLAYDLHYNNRREMDLEHLENLAIKLMINITSISDSKQALLDLYNPSNILIPMTEVGEYGFGHLRFQEHLAARELCLQQNIDFKRILRDPWWRGVLELYSQMKPDIEWLIQDIATKSSIRPYRETLKAMIEVRNAHERSKLNALMEQIAKFGSIT